MGLPEIALAAVMICWFVFGVRFYVGHVRVRRERGLEDRSRDLRAPASMAGLLLECVALLVVFSWRKPLANTSGVAALAAILIAAASVYLASESVRHLGRQLRFKAVVTADHELITSGPYGIVRHPIYLSLMGMAIASGLLLTRWEGLLIALVIYVIGTEIRVRAEDGILHRRFGPKFDDYSTRVRAYLPYLR